MTLPKLCRNGAFLRNLHIRKLGGISVFHAKPNTVQSLDLSLESPKANGKKKTESIMHLKIFKDKHQVRSAGLLHPKEDLRGHSSKVYRDCKFFNEEIIFLKKELDK